MPGGQACLVVDEPFRNVGGGHSLIGDPAQATKSVQNIVRAVGRHAKLDGSRAVAGFTVYLSRFDPSSPLGGYRFNMANRSVDVVYFKADPRFHDELAGGLVLRGVGHRGSFRFPRHGHSRWLSGSGRGPGGRRRIRPIAAGTKGACWPLSACLPLTEQAALAAGRLIVGGTVRRGFSPLRVRCFSRGPSAAKGHRHQPDYQYDDRRTPTDIVSCHGVVLH